MTEPKTVTLRYFDKESEDSTSSTWKCHGKVGNEPCERIIVRKAGAGWTNTFNHVKSFHPEWEQDSKQSQLAFTASPVENVYCWIDWVTTNLKPFSFVEEEETRNYTKLKPIANPVFEAAIVKLQNQLELDEEERDAVKGLLKHTDVDAVQEVAVTETDFAKNIIKKKRTSAKGVTEYESTKFIFPTSDIVERFFSSAGYALSDLRSSILPANLEMQLFLKVNKSFWDRKTVQKAMNNL